jgi:AcrR family transcriptional regulator
LEVIIVKGAKHRAEINRERVLQAALELFQTHGIKKVAINDIAQKAGVTPATVYNQFGSKDALVRDAVKNWYICTLKDYQKVLRAEQPFEEKLQNIISFKSKLSGKLHGEFLLATTSDDPEIRQFLESEYMVEMKQSFFNFFDEGRRQGYISPELSTETILRFTEIIRRGINAESDLSAEPDYSARLLRELTPIILYGMFGRPGK